MYLLIYITAPYFAQYYNDYQIVSILRIQGLGIILTSFFVVQTSKLKRDLKFRNIFITQIFATILQGSIGIILAILNFGVWALVYSNLSYLLATFLGVSYFTRDFIFTQFSLKSLKIQFGFSFRILLNSLSDSLLNLFISTIIYREFDASTLGYYNRGSVLPILVISNIDGAINTVMFPIISRIFNERQDVKNIVRKSFLVSFYFVFPAMIGLATISQPLLTFLFSDKWVGSTIFMQIISLTVTTWIFSIFSNTVNAMGRSDLTFLSNILVKSLAIIVILITYNYGMLYFLIGMMFYSIVNCVIQSVLAQRLINYTIIEQMIDLSTMIFNTFIMGISVYGFMLLTNSNPKLVILYSIVGIILYVLGSIMMKVEAYYFMKSIIIEYFNVILKRRKD